MVRSGESFFFYADDTVNNVINHKSTGQMAFNVNIEKKTKENNGQTAKHSVDVFMSIELL